MNLPLLTISARYGWMTQQSRFSASIAGREKKNYTLLEKHQLSYNHGNSKVAIYGTVYELTNYDEALVPKVYHSFSLTPENSSKFIESYFHTKKLDAQLRKFIASTARMDGLLNISFDDFMKVKLFAPEQCEQSKISRIINLIEKLITLQQRKLEQLKQLKKAMLQQLFVDKNSKQPNLRFKNFNGEWEQRKLGTVGKTQSGIGFPTKEQGGQKGVPFFKVSDMNNNGNEFEMTTSNNYVTEQQIISKKWKTITKVPAVIFAKVGAALMLNRKRLVTVPFLIDNNTMAYMFGKNWDPYFGKVLFDTLNLPKYAQTGALPSFNGSDIENIKVMFPTQVEQQIIGCFFESINGLITHQQNKLTQLTTLKKYLLQNLFI